ncbi:MAG: TIGR03936 family radical SAM-associated protein [Gemmataceae bacterium]|nr:TIGR03936 family radical SAM-associated protein [Gemmata sp.]MDW8196726.1 TIGR03936 family radical SAM-associated protein [Gemmataceae bacterium]
MTGEKFRLRFAKAGLLRLISHHDLMRCIERMLRRAAIPFKSTAGFRPSPRLVFALSLPLGVVGRDEVVELELTEPRNATDILNALNHQAPEGLTFTQVRVVPPTATARVRRVVYELPLAAERRAAAQRLADQWLRETAIWVERLKPTAKRLNIRPYIRGIHVGATVALDLWVTQDGTARAEEVLRLVGLDDWAESGAILERTRVELRDEVSATDPTDAPPDRPPESVPLTAAEIAALTARLKTARDQQPAVVASDWGASPNGPVVE